MHTLDGVVYVNPVELNTMITAITNHLYCKLSQKDFDYLAIVLNELSKEMFSIALLRKICEWDQPKKPGDREKK